MHRCAWPSCGCSAAPMARVPADATAYAHRASRIMVNVAAFYDGPDEAAIARLGRRPRRRAAAGRRRRPT